MEGCKYDVAWVGRCKKDVVEGTEYCPDHLNHVDNDSYKAKCCQCGEQATHECPETFQFVCGSPLCGKETCKIKHHPKHYKFTPTRWAEVYGIPVPERFDNDYSKYKEIEHSDFMAEATKPLKKHLAEQIEKAVEGTIELRAFQDILFGNIDGKHFKLKIDVTL